MQSYHVVINKKTRMSENERPADLVEPVISFAPNVQGEKRLMRREAAYNIEQMFSFAGQQNIELAAISGYRSYERQQQIYEESLLKKGREHTERYIAPPGASEHQTGLAMDVSSPAVGYELEDEFERTKEGIWLRRYASKFGFILRYPKGKEHITGYAYEPWHIRYVTKPLAVVLTNRGLVLEELSGV